MSTAGICGNILGLMNWKSQIQDEIILAQKKLRGWTEEDSYWTQVQNNFQQGNTKDPIKGSSDMRSPTNMDGYELAVNITNTDGTPSGKMGNVIYTIGYTPQSYQSGVAAYNDAITEGKDEATANALGEAAQNAAANAIQPTSTGYTDPFGTPSISPVMSITSLPDATQASVWQAIENEIDNSCQEQSQNIQAQITDLQSEEATVDAEIAANQADNKENNKEVYGNPFAQ